ncbi:hypothetical protein [Nocardia wallacei]|uniref:hypothetical protein n=1 Tax=Nocardia wallacei TaxID=480035 RepID=UPI002453F235|nr:hypothetical protein [Nocardia wallacei]
MDWQTKDSACTLGTVYVVDVMLNRDEMRMVGGCEDCGYFVETKISRDKSLTVGQMLHRMAEEKGYEPPLDATETGEPA